MISSRLLRRLALPATLAAASLLVAGCASGPVYQGGVEGIVSQEMLQDPRASLTEAVARVFEGYPFVAGQSASVPPARGILQ